MIVGLIVMQYFAKNANKKRPKLEGNFASSVNIGIRVKLSRQHMLYKLHMWALNTIFMIIV